MHFVKIDPKVFHFALHIPIFHADLYHLGISVARILAHGFEHLTVEDRRPARAAVFGE